MLEWEQGYILRRCQLGSGHEGIDPEGRVHRRRQQETERWTYIVDFHPHMFRALQNKRELQ